MIFESSHKERQISICSKVCHEQKKTNKQTKLLIIVDRRCIALGKDEKAVVGTSFGYNPIQSELT